MLARIFGSQETLADASDNPGDYLAEGGEIIFSKAIEDQANILQNDPLRMLNFVRNEVNYIPYYGSKKGAEATLVELAGNDLDKVSLLIAMLRFSNIPARYRHVNAKMSIRTVTDLLGVDSAIGAARILSLEKIPYTLYTQNGDPVYFVVEHTYVEAYIPYGYSRGVDMSDGGTSQWVPMDPTINSYYYEQLVDVIDHLKNNGFVVENFFENYLNNAYGALEPLEAFKSEVVNKLASNPPTYYPNLTYDDALTRFYPKIQNLEFIPGSLPFDISANLNTYDYLPIILRHTIKFTVKDKDDNVALTQTAYISDLADKELLITYKAATPEDQAVIDTFDTIYDVVPLSLVAVRPVIKVQGAIVATSAITAPLGQKQKYTLDFSIPTRILGGPVNTIVVETLEENTLTGTTNAIAFNTDRVIPPELRPTEDTASVSYMSDQMLYRTAVDYLDRLQYTHGELADIIGSDFTHIATGAVISNGISVTNSGGQPYSFDWKGLRIDSSAKVRYFNRFSEDTNKYRGEFVAFFALQASQDESDIFEDNFNVESVATVKGLKKVSSGYFPNTTMKKITSANESEIDSLAISSGTKTAFHTAITDGKTIFTPTKPVTYGEWQGLFYITTNFNDEASYIIGEGLNGGYTTIEQFPGGIDNILRRNAVTLGVTASIVSPANNSTYEKGDIIHWVANYNFPFYGTVWTEKKDIITEKAETGIHILRSGYGTNARVNVNITLPPNPLNINTEKIYSGCGKDATGKGIGNCTVANRKESDIKQIVLHFTIGGDANTTVNYFYDPKTLGTDNGVSAHYVVDRNGNIYQVVNDKDLAWHAGIRSKNPTVSYHGQNKTIGIEIANFGPLIKTGDKYFIDGLTRKPEFIQRSDRVVFPASWRSYSYWEDFYSPQMNSVNRLIDSLVDKYAVEKIIYEKNGIKNIMDFEENENILKNFNGIVGHSNIADYKHDPGPAFQKRLFDLLGI